MLDLKQYVDNTGQEDNSVKFPQREEVVEVITGLKNNNTLRKMVKRQKCTSKEANLFIIIYIV